MNKKNIIIIAVVGTVLVFLGILLIVVNQIRNQNQEKENRENNLVTYYSEFKDKADKFADKRIKYTEKVVENMYYESVNDEYDDWIKELSSYNQLVDDILSSAKSLEKLCVNQVYTKEELKNNCDAYIINYETVMNYFVKDVEEFNSFISNYNNEYDSKVDTYQFDANKYHYLDINDDGKFIGKD